MPVRDEASYIQRSLESVFAQDYPLECMEIVIIDGLSTDGTREIITKLAIQNPEFHITILDNPGLTVPIGLNSAIPQTKGQIIVRVDGHCEIASDYIRRCVEHIQEVDVDGVGGSINTSGETWIARVIAVAISSPFGVGGSAFRTIRDKTMLTDTVPFPAYTRSIIKRAGLYDEELVRNQDDEYNYRVRELGGKILLAADIHSKYYSRSTLLSLWRQFYQYGFWKVRVLQKHPLQMRARQFVPPVFSALLITSAILAFFTPIGCFMLILVPGTYLLANLGASFWTAIHESWRYLHLLPLVYFIIHFSYGLGFLVGLVRFANRWGDKQGKVPTWDQVRARFVDNINLV